MENGFLSAPLILLATIWVSAAPVLAANTTLHDQRDLVSGIRNLAHLSPARALQVRRAAFLHSYIPLLIGILIFLAMMSGFIVYTAWSLHLPKDQEPYRWLCYMVALMPAFMFIGFAFGGGKNVFVMWQILNEEKEAATSPATPGSKIKSLNP